MRSTTRRAAATAALALFGALLLSACTSGSGSGSGSDDGATGSASAAASVTASVPATATGGSTAAPTASAPASGASTVGSAACRNLVATDAVKGAVTRDYGAYVNRGQITPRPHQFLYGECGGTTYAATAFDLTAGATEQDQVANQDEGSTRKYFSLSANGTWTLIGDAGFPDTGGCAPKIPQDLAKLWGGCQPGSQQ